MRRIDVMLGTLVLGLALSGCGSSGTGTTETIGTSTTNSTVSRSTMSAPTTVSVSTTVPVTTTTSLEGEWAELPVIVSGIDGLVLGWWDGESWVAPDPQLALPASSGQDYQTALLDDHRIIMSGGRVEGCDIRPATLPAISFEDLALLGSNTDPKLFGIAVSAPWPIDPRPISKVSGQASEAHHIVKDLLAGLGIEVDDPKLAQALEADVDGDGWMELLTVAENTNLTATAGNYSLALLVADGNPSVIDRSVFPPGGGSDDIPQGFRVSAVADLDGDDLMEIVLTARGVEWMTSAVYDWRPGGGVEKVLEVGCGL